MTARQTRQSGLLLAGVAAILPLAALSWAPAYASTASTVQYTPTTAPFTVTRTLRRAMADGKEVVSRRTYEVQIVRDGDGYRVDGRQIDCTVEAPPVLQALAAIERARIDTGMFPISLDARGMITNQGLKPDIASREEAAGVVATIIGQSKLPNEDRQQANAFVSQIRSQSAGLSAWPLDLFHAKPGRRSETRQVDLPDGSQGKVTISVEARRSSVSRLDEIVERVVVTELGGSERITREEWRLTPIER
jgi:hypothetical protein